MVFLCQRSLGGRTPHFSVVLPTIECGLGAPCYALGMVGLRYTYLWYNVPWYDLGMKGQPWYDLCGAEIALLSLL